MQRSGMLLARLRTSFKSERSESCYCAFCRSPRAIYRKRHVGIVDLLLALASSWLLSMILWQDLDPRAVVVFVLGLGLAEMFVIFRWRLSIACSRCGFDPVLYKKSPEKAAEKVRRYIDERRNDPLGAFSLPPKLPKMRRKAIADSAMPFVDKPKSAKRSEATR